MRQKLIEWYLDYVNNWTTTAKFAEHHEITEEEVLIMIELGKKYHEEYVSIMKS